jgi:Tfp pilus assembly protein PilF
MYWLLVLSRIDLPPIANLSRSQFSAVFLARAFLRAGSRFVSILRSQVLDDPARNPERERGQYYRYLLVLAGVLCSIVTGAETHYNRGAELLAEHDPAAAEQEFRRAVQAQPASPEAHLGLGLALGQTAKLDQAAAEFRSAIKLRPNYAEAHKGLGITLRRLGDDKRALNEFQAAVAADANDPESWYNLGLARKSAGDLSGSIEAFNRAITIKPDFEQAHYNLATAMRAAGHHEAARDEMEQLRGLHDFREKLTESKALIMRGVDLLKQNRNQDALNLFEQASVQSPSLPTAWHYLGVAYDRMGQLRQAMAAWKKALELQPDYPKTHTSIGLMYARAGNFEVASKEFRDTVSSDPDDAEAHYNLGLALAKLGHLDEAGSELSEAVALNPSYIDARVQLALVLADKGLLPAAANVYRELIRQQPNSAEIHNNFGLVLLQMNDFDGARREFNLALQLKPGFVPAQQNAALTEPCQVGPNKATLVVPHVAAEPALDTDPKSATWRQSASTVMSKDCSHKLDYPDLSSEVRVFWTDDNLYLLFICPYKSLNIWTPTQNDQPRNKLWDRDVVEFFLGSDWNEIRKYREFEIAPTADWIDLAIDLSRKSYDHSWRSGWQTKARIDEAQHIWYAAARVPLKSVSEEPVKAGTRWRMNLYRIDGDGPDSKRHFLCWQPTCAGNRDPNHVPENFGTLVFSQ